MNIVTPFTVLLFVLNANALDSNASPYQANYGNGSLDQDVDRIDSSSDRLPEELGS